MSWAYDQAVQLLNASKLATDGASKLVRLARVRGASHAALTPPRLPLAARPPAARRAAFPQGARAGSAVQRRAARATGARARTPAPRARGFLTTAQAEPTAAVRKFLATVLDALAGSSVQLVAPCAAAAICLLRVRSGAHTALADLRRASVLTRFAGLASRRCEGGAAVGHRRASAHRRACVQAGVCVCRVRPCAPRLTPRAAGHRGATARNGGGVDSFTGSVCRGVRPRSGL